MSNDLYYRFAELPTYTSAEFIGKAKDSSAEAPLQIRVTTSNSDHLRNAKRNLVKYLFVSSDPKGSISTPPQDLADAVSTQISPSGAYSVVLRETYSEEDKKKRFVEVWQGGSLYRTKDVTDMHGSFLTDEVFSSTGFSSSEKSFIYTAQIERKEAEIKDKGVPYEKYRFQPKFGERYKNIKAVGLFVVEWGDAATFVPKSGEERVVYKSLQVQRLRVAQLKVPDPESRIHFGQGVLDETGGYVYATGYEPTKDGRFLGIIGCYNRPSAIWRFKLKKEYKEDGTIDSEPEKLTEEGLSCRSPRIIYHDGKGTLVYLAHKTFGPHHSCAQLYAIDLATKANKVLVDTVWEADLDSEDFDRSFPGLYVEQLPKQPFVILNSSPHILLQSVRTHFATIYIVSLKTGAIQEVTHADPQVGPGKHYSWTLFGTDGATKFLCARSRIDVPNELILGTFFAPHSADLRVIDSPPLAPEVSRALDRLCLSLYHLPLKRHVESIIIETIEHTRDSPAPAIMVPHGGPHTVSVNVFNAQYAALALEGYTLYLPNYTGSLGYGQKYLTELIGQCGVVDVHDCIATAQGLVENGITKDGVTWQFVYGGSHGGYLAAHLIGSYPTFFSAAVMRNPVISVPEMIATTDIPDWSFSEFGLPYGTNGAVLNATTSAFLYTRSPISKVHEILAPVYLLIGEDDQRVPPSQGKNFYHALKGLDKVAEMLVFPGNGHPLDQVESMRMSFETLRGWFNAYKE